ncbi:MAG: mechanosensitive ion channel family protein [Pseudomonadota bacterium]
MAQGTAEAPPPVLPDNLTPELVDSLLAELTDDQVRRLLRNELQRQAEEGSAEVATEMTSIADLTRRLDEMLATIGARITRWIDALSRIEERQDRVAERIALGSGGAVGIALSMGCLVLAGFGAGIFVARLLRPWRERIADYARSSDTGGYWEVLARAAVLIVVDLLPIAAFSVVTTFATRLLSGSLGPLLDYGWIYQAGVTNGWAFLVLITRAFSPDFPKVRLASVNDASASAVVRLGRQVVTVAVSGWLIGGLSPTLGFGFPPAMVIVGSTGVIVALILIAAVLRNRHAIVGTVSGFLPTPNPEIAAPWQRTVSLAAPFAALLYILIAATYWLLHWLESGQLYLQGPASTLLVLLSLPLFDRLGSEAAAAMTRRATQRALRFRSALIRLWRLFLAIIGIGVITRLWGFNFWDLAHGTGAPEWRAAALNILYAFLSAWAAWQLIRAALWHERRQSTGAEEDDNSEVGGASRLDTLLPLFRVFLGIVILLTFVMYALSEAGLNIGPLLASAGIVGVAVGFGAQTLVRDIFSGIFFLIDDAFRVGEYIELEADLRGEVEAISIRSLQLRHHRGPVVTIPFGELKSVTNHHRDWVIYKMNFRMEPETDPKLVKKLVKRVGQEFLENPEHGHKFLEPLKSQGVYMVDDDSALVFRVKFKCKPRQQFVLRREIYHRLREVFAENEVNLARRKVEVVTTGGEDAPPGLPDEVIQPKAATPAA